MENIVNQHFDNVLNSLALQSQDVFDNTVVAATVLSVSVSTYNKIICVGSSLCQPICQMFSQQLNLALIEKFNFPRLGAMTLNSNANKLNYLVPKFGTENSIFLEYRSLLSVGDTTLIVVENVTEYDNFKSSIQYAHDNGINIVIIGNANDEELANLLSNDSDDVNILLNADNDMSFLEIALCTVNSILATLLESLRTSDEDE